MKFNLLKALILFSFIYISCSSDDDYGNCIDPEQVSIIPEGVEIRACVFQELYLYNGEYYTVPYCCTCNMIYMAYDCDGHPLCDVDDDCMQDFSEKAAFQFTFLET